MRRTIGFVILFALSSVIAVAPIDAQNKKPADKKKDAKKETPKAEGPKTWPPTKSPYSTNPNGLVKKHGKKIKLEVSSTWDGWPVEKAFDGNLSTSWFSAANDIGDEKKGTGPWVLVKFPQDVIVKRITVLGNREKQWVGYQVTRARIELLDAMDEGIENKDLKAEGDAKDIDFKPEQPLAKVRSVRVTALYDDGAKNVHKDIGIAEIQID